MRLQLLLLVLQAAAPEALVVEAFPRFSSLGLGNLQQAIAQISEGFTQAAEQVQVVKGTSFLAQDGKSRACPPSCAVGMLPTSIAAFVEAVQTDPCCVPACSAFVCPTNYTLISAASMVGGATIPTCCMQSFCGSYSCPANFVQISPVPINVDPNAGSLFQQCCVPSCSGYTCPPSGTGYISCATSGAATTAGNTAQQCCCNFDAGSYWTPLSMTTGPAMTSTPSVLLCQQQCASTVGCMHFSWNQATQSCYLQDGMAVRAFADGWQSGAPTCATSPAGLPVLPCTSASIGIAGYINVASTSQSGYFFLFNSSSFTFPQNSVIKTTVTLWRSTYVAGSLNNLTRYSVFLMSNASIGFGRLAVNPTNNQWQAGDVLHLDLVNPQCELGRVEDALAMPA